MAGQLKEVRNRIKSVTSTETPIGPIDVTAFLDVINVTAASASDETEFDYRRGVQVQDSSEAEPLIGLRFDYAW